MGGNRTAACYKEHIRQLEAVSYSSTHHAFTLKSAWASTTKILEIPFWVGWTQCT